MVSDARLRLRSPRPVSTSGDYVLLWMTATRRAHDNFSLDYALDEAARLGRPLLVFEPLRADYPYASERFHRFVVEGMADQRAAFGAAGIRYLPYVEPTPGAGRGLLEALMARACLVVADRSPAFFLPRMVTAAAERSPVRFVEVDSIGLLPLSASPRPWPSAATFRRSFQRTWPDLYDQPRSHLAPAAGPLAVVPPEVLRRWGTADALLDRPDDLARLVGGPRPVAMRGGSTAALRRLDTFVAWRLARYGDRSHPDADAASGLSPWIHFGHLSPHTVFRAVVDGTDWGPERLGKVTGSREGFWGLDPAREGFLDELVIWRELAHGFTDHVADAETFATLPEWARKTLGEHAGDERVHRYGLAQFESAATHDPLWNAAQNQLVRDGYIQNYLRMLWGKKVLEWSASPEEAFETLVTLNHRYAVDGRDPNSTAGIAWCFGRFDRPWFPERPVYGTIRYMTSDSTRKKLKMKDWLTRYQA